MSTYKRIDMKEYISHFRDEKVTVIGTYDDQNNLHLRASRCSDNDQFCKKVGRETARKRPPQLIVRHEPKFTTKSRQTFFVHTAGLCAVIFEDNPHMLIKTV